MGTGSILGLATEYSALRNLPKEGLNLEFSAQIWKFRKKVARNATNFMNEVFLVKWNAGGGL